MLNCPQCNSDRVVYEYHDMNDMGVRARRSHAATSTGRQLGSGHPLGALLTIGWAAGAWLASQTYEQIRKKWTCNNCGHKFR